MSDAYLMINMNGDNYERTMHSAGVRTTVCKNRFEIACSENAEINEAQIVSELRTWIKRREDKVREPGSVPG